MDLLSSPRTSSAASTVRHVMTPEPVTVSPSTGFREAVRLLVETGVDALPVVEDGRLVGLVAADDLLLKEEVFELPHGGTGMPWQRHRDRVRAEGREVAAVMDRQPPKVHPDTSLGRAARELHRRHRGGLLVVDDDGALLGIVTRTDLLSVYLREDGDLQRDVEALLDPGTDVRATVQEGCVRLEGNLPYVTKTTHLVEAVRHVPGVVSVDCRIRSDVDDVHLALGC